MYKPAHPNVCIHICVYMSECTQVFVSIYLAHINIIWANSPLYSLHVSLMILMFRNGCTYMSLCRYIYRFIYIYIYIYMCEYACVREPGKRVIKMFSLYSICIYNCSVGVGIARSLSVSTLVTPAWGSLSLDGHIDPCVRRGPCWTPRGQLCI